MGYTMRTERYRYTEWRDRKSGEPRAWELYDHQKDSQENVNVINRPEYAEDIRKLENTIKQAWRGASPEYSVMFIEKPPAICLSSAGAAQLNGPGSMVS